jgi:hypothetical protein
MWSRSLSAATAPQFRVQPAPVRMVRMLKFPMSRFAAPGIIWQTQTFHACSPVVDAVGTQRRGTTSTLGTQSMCQLVSGRSATSPETAFWEISPVKSRHIRLAENGNLPRNNAPRLSTASPGVTSTARGACRASSDSSPRRLPLCRCRPLVLVAGHLGLSGRRRVPQPVVCHGTYSGAAVAAKTANRRHRKARLAPKS